MKHPLKPCAALVLLLAAQTVHAANFYVASTGSDINPGTESAPFKTIQKAINTAIAGDTVFIRGGTYNEVVLATRSGVAGNPITFINYPGETPVLDATGKSSADYWNGVFALRGTATNKISHIRVQGLKVQNFTSGFGISCYYCADSEIRSNKTYNTRLSGIVVGYGDRIVVDGNDIEKANHGGEQENLSILRESSFVSVTNNVVHDNGNDANGGEGIDIKQGAHDVLVQGNTVYNNTKVGIYVDAWDKSTYNIMINRNRVYGVGKSAITLGSECGGPLRNVTISNNLVYGNTRHGVNIGIWGDMFGQCGSPAPTPGNIRGVKIVNNTIVGNGQVGINYTRDAGVPVHPDFGDIYVANNLIHDNGHKALNFAGCPISHNGNPEIVAYYTIETNLLNGPAGKPRCDWGSEMPGNNYLLAAPQLAGAADFRLTSSSPAIDVGTASNAPDHDYEGMARPANGAWDLGAYEYSGQPADLNITTASLPQGTAGLYYSASLDVSGGTAPYTWHVAGGALPDGLVLNAGGVIQGTPTRAGTVNVMLGVTDGRSSLDTQELNLVVVEPPVVPPPEITTSTLALGTAGVAYSATLQASGGAAPLSWSVASGVLPAGLSLSATGVLAGTPAASGAFAFSVAATDANGLTDSQALSLTINAAPPVTGSADMALTMFKATRTAVSSGSAAEFSFTVKNNGANTASNARFTLPLPANMVWVKGGNGSECAATASQAVCNFGTLAKSATRTRYIYLRPTSAGVCSLTGAAASDLTDAIPSNNSRSVSLTAN